MILRNLPMNDYHAHSAVSNSKLKDFHDGGPLYFKKKHIDKTIHEERTEALLYGAAFDTLLTEPERFQELYAVKPTGMSFATKEGKQWKIENLLGPTPGVERDIIPEQVHKDFEEMRESLLAHPIIGVIITHPDSEAQVSLRHQSKPFGIEMQTRPDWINLKGITGVNMGPSIFVGMDDEGMPKWKDPAEAFSKPFIADLKTTQNFSDWFDWCQPTSDRAIRSVVKYAYHRQAALAQHVAIQDPAIGKVEQFLIVVEKQEPFRCGVFQISDAVLDEGFLSIERDLQRLKRCMDSNEWPNSPPSLVMINKTQWLKDQADRERDAFEDEQRAQEMEMTGGPA